MIKKLILFLLLSVVLISCGNKKLIEQRPESSETSSTNAEEIIEKSKDSAVTIYQKKISKSQIQEERNKYLENDLKQIPVNPKYNAMVFKIYNVKSYHNTYFFAPKVYAYGGSDNSRLAPKDNKDGTVTLDFPIILIDGTTKEIPANDGVSIITIPETLRVQKQEELQAELSSRVGSTQYPAVLPGCPKKVYLKVSNQEYDVTPSSFKNGDYCQLNAPFSVSVTLPERDARYLVEEALYNNSVDINVMYETKARLSIAQMKVEFDKQKTYNELSSKLKVNHPYAEVELRAHVKNVIQKMSLNMSMVGEINDRMELIVSKAIDMFFEKFEQTPNSQSTKCGSGIVCFRLNYNSMKDSKTLAVSWHHSKNILTGQNFVTWAKLRPLNDIVKIGGEGRKKLAKGKSFETGLTVVSGDLVVITPSSLSVEQRHAKSPHEVTHNNNVCIKTSSRCRHENRDGICISYEKYCSKHQNQWTKITNYGLSKPVMKVIYNPLGQFKEIYEGLSFKFTYSRNGKLEELTCPLRSFRRVGHGKNIVIKIENNLECDIFNSGSNQPMLNLVNNISLYPVKYKKGRYVRHWNGSISQKPIEEIYTPNIEFSGEVMIRGYRVGNTISHSSEF